jgi:hypothetical protein
MSYELVMMMMMMSVVFLCQVCALLWSSEYRELVSSHGFAQNQLILWKYPTMAKVAELTGKYARKEMVLLQCYTVASY